MAERRIGALVLAAGLSSRMIGFKPLLRIGEKAFIEHAISLFTISGITNVVTVVGYRSDELIPLVEACSSRWVMNRNFRDGMFSSIQLGALKLQGNCDAFFLLPVDIPFVHQSTIRKLITAFATNHDFLVYYPQFQSRSGHPPLIDASLIPQIRTYEGINGMRGVLASCKERSLSVLVEDPFICMDADTREDLSSLQRVYFSKRPDL